MKKLVFTALAFLSTLLTTHAQKEANHWLWGDSTRMDFTGGSPVTFFKKNNTWGGGNRAVISHPQTGKLLFYSDGWSVFDSTGAVMPNGSNLAAGNVIPNFRNFYKGSVIVPNPENSNLYYLFSASYSGAIVPGGVIRRPYLYYSVIDMKLRNDLGDVIIRDTPIFKECAGVLTATQHCNGKDYWIITHSNNDKNTHDFHVFPVTSSGVGEGIISKITLLPDETPGDYINPYIYHNIVVSPNGKKLFFPNANRAKGKIASFELHDFNTATGEVVNPIRLEVLNSLNLPNTTVGINKAAFSTDNTKLYIIASDALKWYLYQYDISSDDADSINVSKILIASAGIAGMSWFHLDMQLAQDDKIYILFGGKIAAIDKPNVSGIKCEFSYKNNLWVSSNGYSLFPNFPNYYFNEKKENTTCAKPKAVFKTSPICEGSSANFKDESENEPTYRKWEFTGGIPSVYIGVQPPPVLYPKAGTFPVKLITKNVFGSDTLILSQIVNPLPQIITNASVELCRGDTAQLSAKGGNSYRWSPGADLSDSTIADPLAWAHQTRKYTLTVTDSNGCVVTKEVVVNVRQVMAGDDVITCLGAGAQLQASGGISYKWISESGTTDELNDPNIANPIVKTNKTTRYIVTATHQSGCTTSDTILVTVTDTFKAFAGKDVSICEGDSIQLSASGGSIYEWSPRTGLNDFRVANPIAYPKETTEYVVTIATADALCIDSDTVVVTVLKKPVADAGESQTICTGSSVQLQGSGGIQYRWFPGHLVNDSVIANPIATQEETTDFTLRVTNENGCVAYATVRIYVLDKFNVYAGDSLKICRDESIQLQANTNVSGGIITYDWSPKDGTLSDYNTQFPIAKPEQTTTYFVKVTREENGALCYGEDSVTVIVKEKPVITTSFEEITICVGDSVQLSANGAFQYRWNPQEGLSNYEMPNPLAFPLKTTVYTVEGVNESGCKSSKEIRVIVREKDNINFLLKTDPAPLTIGESRKFTLGFTSEQEGVNSFELRVRLQSDLLKMNLQNIITSPEFKQSWDVSGFEKSAGEYIITAKNNSGDFLKSGELEFNGEVFLSKVLDNTIYLDVISVNGISPENKSCLIAKSSNTEVRFEAICAGDMRLVSLSDEKFALQQNKPNPFSEETEIEYSIGLAGNATITLLNPMGEVVTILKDEFHRPGKYVLKFAAKDLPSGVYYCQLTSGPFSATYPLVIIK